MITNTEIKTANGAKAIIETLKNLGVDTIFGYPGGIVLDIYDELGKDNQIKHILMRHEQSAVHAAEGYARKTGKCGVVLVTSGPGATNTISGIVNAYLDGYPLLILTGQVSNNLIGKNAFQEAKICDITKTCTKKNFQITNANSIEKTITEALTIAMSDKKGPVVVDIVKDIFKQNVELNSNYNISCESAISTDISRLTERLNSASKPVIICGGGVKHSNAQDELYKFASTHNIPVVSSMMGLGAYKQDERNYFGMIGIFGDKSANQIIEESDFILSLGCRFNDRITCMFNLDDISKKYFQIDINPNEISNFFKAQDFLIGDIKQILNQIKIDKDYYLWLENSQALKFQNEKYERSTNLLHSFEVIQALNKYTSNRQITFTTEVGQHLILAAKTLDLYKDRQLFISGGSGTMGFGFPAAIGASIAEKSNNPVVCITGDGSFQMGIQELAVCNDYNLNLKIIILNNGYLGMVRQLQEKNCNRRYFETKISNPDFITLAKSYNIEALNVSTKEQIIPALEKAFSNDKTFIINFNVEPMEVV